MPPGRTPGRLKQKLASLPGLRNLGGRKEKQWTVEEEHVDLQVGRTCWSGVQRKMRTELWLSVLHRQGLGSRAAQSYPAMYAQGQALPEEVASDIEKDVDRTFPEMARFATGKGVQSLTNILKAYAAMDPEVGYCQGMNFLAGVVLTYLPSEADAYGALVLLMKQRHLRELYKQDLAWLQVRLWQMGKLLPARLAAHLEAAGCLPVLYLPAWLLTAFASAYPLAFAARLVDVMLTDSFAEPMLKVALRIMAAAEKQLLAMHDMEEMVEYLKVEVPSWPVQELQDILTDALSTSWTPQQVAILEQTLGSETVLEAVRRNEQEAAGMLTLHAGGGAEAPALPVAPSRGAAAPAVSAGAMPAVQLLPPPPDWAARRASQRAGGRMASPFQAGARQGSPFPAHRGPGSPFRASLSPAASSGSVGAGAASSTCGSDGFGDFMGSDEVPAAGAAVHSPHERDRQWPGSSSAAATAGSSTAAMQRNGAPRRQASGLSPQQRSAGVASAAVGPHRRTAQAPGHLDSADLLQSWSADFDSNGAAQGVHRQPSLLGGHSSVQQPPGAIRGAPRQPSVSGGPSSVQQPSGAFAQLNLQDFAAGYASHAERSARRLPLSEHDFTARGMQTGWVFPSKPQPRWR